MFDRANSNIHVTAQHCALSRIVTSRLPDFRVAQVGWTASDEDRDRWLAVNLWLSRNHPTVHAKLQQGQKNHAVLHEAFDLSCSPPRDFLSSQDSFDIVVVHNIWSRIATDRVASRGTAISSLHSPSAWIERIAAASAHHIFLFGVDHDVHSIDWLQAGYVCIVVPAAGGLSVLVKPASSASPTATQPITYQDMTTARLNALLELHDNVSLDLSYTGVRGCDLHQVARMPDLANLRLVGTSITDVDAATIAGCDGLRILCLDETCITDQALAPLARLPLLECLSLNETRVGDTGVGHLATLRNLSWLSMVGTIVSDDAVEAIGRHRSLSSVSLVGTRVSAAGLRRLQDLLPDCSITPEPT